MKVTERQFWLGSMWFNAVAAGLNVLIVAVSLTIPWLNAAYVPFSASLAYISWRRAAQ